MAVILGSENTFYIFWLSTIMVATCPEEMLNQRLTTSVLGVAAETEVFNHRFCRNTGPRNFVGGGRALVSAIFCMARYSIAILVFFDPGRRYRPRHIRGLARLNKAS
jgi:hypothetical protein